MLRRTCAFRDHPTPVNDRSMHPVSVAPSAAIPLQQAIPIPGLKTILVTRDRGTIAVPPTANASGWRLIGRLLVLRPERSASEAEGSGIGTRCSVTRQETISPAIAPLHML